jgi:alkylated DNA repair dioxygenase AlkB
LSFLEKKDAEYKKKSSYMFSGHDDTKNNGELPAVFQPYFDYIKSKFPDCDFNQVSINWYENGQDYIAFHRDCEVGMKGNKNICILTFNETEKEEDARNLEFKFDTKVIGKSLQENFSIPLYHGSIVILTSQIQKYYRHGIKQSPISTRRISMSFRQFEE